MILTFLLEVRNLDGLCIEQLTQLKPVQDREGIIGADPWPGLWFTVESARGLVGGVCSVWPLASGLSLQHCPRGHHGPTSHLAALSPGQESLFSQLGVRHAAKPLAHSLWPGRCGAARKWWPLSEPCMSGAGGGGTVPLGERGLGWGHCRQ